MVSEATNSDTFLGGFYTRSWLFIFHISFIIADCFLTDDEPDDGSDHYIMVSGLHHPHLPSQLAELGVHIDSIIKVESDDYAGLQPPSGSGSDTDREPLDDKQLGMLLTLYGPQQTNHWKSSF